MVERTPVPARPRRSLHATWGRPWGILILLALLLSSCSVSVVAGGRDYDEPLRPQFHYTPRKNWINDPNGLVFYKGEYHLLFQYNPFGNEWGHMSWGHAVSRDMVHWKELPVAIPEQNGVMIFSGSAAVDRRNSRPCAAGMWR